jgi:hypothetical protein
MVGDQVLWSSQDLLSVSPEQFVQAERDIYTPGQELRSSCGRETGKLRGTLTAKAIVIARGKIARKTPLRRAVMRVFQTDNKKNTEQCLHNYAARARAFPDCRAFAPQCSLGNWRFRNCQTSA